MKNILDTIIERKQQEVANRKADIPVSELEQMPLFGKQSPSLVRSLRDPSKTGIIAEFKRKSPSKGVINSQAQVVEVTKAYAANGASGISVLTDTDFFGGSLEDLVAANTNRVPLLRKDFMIDEYQLTEAKAFGADVILLIAACLSPARVKELAIAARQLGLEVLLEIHNEAELAHICDQVDMVGVNNRNLKTFEVSIRASLDLITKIPGSKPAVAESGISEVDTIVTLRQAGFTGFLIGENFMKQTDPSIAFADFVSQLKAKQHA
ncbi:indole-3-glycerol phosphate synthase TrpC [Sediminibacterium soli]|uniref:indole-3-glycerol phosphate synthase TrpC n=1 Tax=Sediminibacterium soli TaxID=2698829 RepID=UPI00137B0E3E|nr:indole-3-glycerol phosphate synthase TrpC [Sediminibacterium soli]NCI46961.1 indole-3-glycerol phosphate synthase TrpC [Sediminibacterium soli]